MNQIDYENHAIERLSDGETVDYEKEYQLLLDKYNYNVRNYNYLIERYDEVISSNNDWRDRIHKQNEQISDFHNHIKEYHTEVRRMLRAKEIKSVEKFNKLISEWGKFSNGWLPPIKTEDMFSARANIIIEGVYTDNQRDIEHIKQLIQNTFVSKADTNISFNFVDVNDVYDVEELTSTQEG